MKSWYAQKGAVVVLKRVLHKHVLSELTLKPQWHTQWILTSLLASWVGMLLCVPFLVHAEEESTFTQSSDVRIVVDISGSMKQNDPQNVRVPAVKVLIKLLPDGSQAGIWTYGQWVNMLVPHGRVNDAWRKMAIERIESIRSVGLRTNIGGALENAMWKLEANSPNQQSLIVLTDGIVDVAPKTDPQQGAKNQRERARILGELALKFQQLTTEVHTIALSQSSDLAMMKDLAARTGGTHFVAKEADDLLRAFTKAYQEAVPTEQVPIKKNRFSIDSDIQEFTALIFRAPGSEPTALVQPNGKRLTQINQNERVRWHSEKQIDLITVLEPRRGEWEIEAKLDPDNRILVVSDLALNIRNVPENIAPGDKIDLEAYLHEDGRILTHPDFLKLMTFRLKVTQEGGRSGTKTLSDPEAPPEDGIYREGLYRLSQEGTYEIQVNVDGKTFERQATKYVTLRDPIQIEVHPENIGTPEESYSVNVIPYSSSIDTQKSRVIAKVGGPDSYSIIQAARKNEEGHWQIKVKPVKGPGDYDVALNIRGKNTDGTEFSQRPEGIPLTFPIPPGMQSYIVGEPITEMEEAVADTEAPSDESQQETEEITEEEATVPNIEPIDDTDLEAAKKEGSVAEESADESQEATVESGIQEETMPPAANKETEETEESQEEMIEEESSILPYLLLGLVLIAGGVGGYFFYRHQLNKSSDDEDTDDLDDLDDDLDDDFEGDEEISLDTDEESDNKNASSLKDQQEDNEEFDSDFDLSATDDDETISLDAPAASTKEVAETSGASNVKTPEEPAANQATPTSAVSDDDFDISVAETASSSVEPEDNKEGSEQEQAIEVKPKVEESTASETDDSAAETEDDDKNDQELASQDPAPPQDNISTEDTAPEDEMPVKMDDPGLDELPSPEDIDDVDVNELMEELDQELGDQAIEDLDDVDIESLVEGSGDDLDEELDDIDVDALMKEMEREDEEAAKKEG